MKEFNLADYYVDPDDMTSFKIKVNDLVGIRLKFALAGGVAALLVDGCEDGSGPVSITYEDGTVSFGLVRYDVVDRNTVMVRYATPHEIAEGIENSVHVHLSQADLVGLKDFGVFDVVPEISDLPIERVINMACGMAALTIEEAVKSCRSSGNH